MKTAEEIERKLRIHIESTEECLENFNLDKTTIDILNQELELLKYVHEYFTTHPTLPSDEEIKKSLMYNSALQYENEREYALEGAKWMRYIASARIAEMEREIEELKADIDVLEARLLLKD